MLAPGTYEIIAGRPGSTQGFGIELGPSPRGAESEWEVVDIFEGNAPVRPR